MIFVSAQNGNDANGGTLDAPVRQILFLGNFETNIGPGTVFFASDMTS